MAAYDINAILRALVFRNEEARKSHLTGEIHLTLEYMGGQITRTRYTLEGPLEPGAERPAPIPPRPPDFDAPGKNRG